MNTFITIPGFEQMTAQQVLEKSVRHVAANGRPSMIDGPSGRACMYGGIGCGAAPFIRPEKRAKVESKTWFSLHAGQHVPDAHFMLVVALQDSHDSAAWGTFDAPSNFMTAYFANVRRNVPKGLDLSFIDALEKGGVR